MRVAGPPPIHRAPLGLGMNNSSHSGRDRSAPSSAAMDAAMRIRRTRQVSQAQLDSKVGSQHDKESSRQKMLRKTKSARDVTRRGSIDRLLANDSKSSAKPGRKRLGKLGLTCHVEEDEKSFTSMGSMSSCGSIGTIGSTNSLRESFKNRRAQSARNIIDGPSTSINPKELILPRPRSSLKATEEKEEEDPVGAASTMLRYCITNHNARNHMKASS